MLFRSATQAVAESRGDGVLRKDTLPSAEERNARLEKLKDIRYVRINVLSDRARLTPSLIAELLETTPRPVPDGDDPSRLSGSKSGPFPLAERSECFQRAFFTWLWMLTTLGDRDITNAFNSDREVKISRDGSHSPISCA